MRVVIWQTLWNRVEKKSWIFSASPVNYMKNLANIGLVRFQVLTAASTKFRFIFWDVLSLTHRPDDGGSMYLWNVGQQLFYTAVHPTRQI
jgi:hypothetical protein